MFKSKEAGVVLTHRIDSIKRLGLDIDAIAGTAAPTNKMILGEHFSDFTGLAGIGLSGSWTYPKSAYFLQAGVSVVQQAGTQPSASVYLMIGVRK